jgi:hypothetical protein
MAHAVGRAEGESAPTTVDEPTPDPPRDQWVTGATILAVATFVLVGIGLPLLGHGAFAGSDLIMTRAPWNSLVPTGFHPQNPYVGDTVDGLLPAAHNFATRLQDGDFASWWSYNTGGAQLGSGGSSGLLSPLSLPYVIFPTWLAPAYVKLLEMLVAVGGMYLFLRKISLTKAAALLGGVVFVSSGFMVAWTNWPHTKVAAFVPALFWAIERLAQSRRPLNVALTAVIVGCLLLGGFPAVATYALVVAGLYLIVRLLTINGWRPSRLMITIGLAAGALLVGVALAAMHLAPFVQELREVAVGPRSQSSSNHAPIVSMVTMLAPDALGGTNPNSGAIGWFGVGHPIEELSYVGAAALLLVVVALVARRRPGVPPFVRGFFVLAAGITVVLVFFGGPLLEAVQQLPVFSTNRIGRARSILGFCLAVLAAVGFDAVIRRPVGGWSASWRQRAWAGLAVAVWLGAGIAAFLLLRDGHRYAFARGHTDWFDGSVRAAAIFGGLALGAALVARGRGWLRTAGLVVIPGLVVVQALLLVLPFWPRVPTSQFYPSTPTHEFLEANVGSDRLLTAGTMQTGTEAYYGLRTVGGRGFVTEKYDDLLRAWCNACFLTPTYMSAPYDPEAFSAPLLDRFGTRYIVADPAAGVLGDAETVGGTSEAMALAPEVPLTVPLAGGPIRALGVDVAEKFVPTDPWAAIDLEVKDATGATLVATSRRIFGGVAEGPFLLAVPEGDVGSAASATLTLHADRPMAIHSASGTAAVAQVRPADDGLVVVHGGDETIYERTTALPRIRWAQTMEVEPDPARAVELVASGTAPDVVLSSPGPTPADAPARVEVTEDSGDTITVGVEAEGLGYLVVADGLEDRWTATVDGAAVPLLEADHGYVAVEVPSGAHTVQFEYDRNYAVIGFAASGAAAVVVGALVFLDRRLRRRHEESLGAARR